MNAPGIVKGRKIKYAEIRQLKIMRNVEKTGYIFLFFAGS